MRRKRVLKILSFSVLISLFLIPIVFAIYRNVSNGNGTLSTATWNVSINQANENNNLSVIPAPNESTASYTINITSNSEVDAIYSIVINNLPSGVSVSIDNGEYVQETNNKIIFADVGTILYSDKDKTKKHSVTFKASSTASFVNNQEVDINVIARQSL